MKYKLILTHHYTKRDVYGNVCHAVRVENIKNGKSFTASTPSLGNVEHILCDAFGGWDESRAVIVDTCTGSARSSSLPEGLHLNPCSFEDGKPYKLSWRKELNKIGFRLPKKKK
jgi:hypothetical protein